MDVNDLCHIFGCKPKKEKVETEKDKDEPEKDAHMSTLSTTRPKLDKIDPELTLETENLVLRPLEGKDLGAYWAIVDGEPDTMYSFWTISNPYPDIADAGRDIVDPRGRGLEKLISFGIFLKNKDGDAEELLGRGGVQMCKGTWPSAWYFIKRGAEEGKYRRKGYATQFLKELLRYWWTLEREDVEVKMYDELVPSLEDPRGSGKAKEVLCAWPKESNKPSQGLLEKVGFKCHGTIEHEEHKKFDFQFWFYTKKD